MGLYGQDAELHLLGDLVGRLDCRTMIHVGAERGNMAHELLRQGVIELRAVEAHPGNASALRARFADDTRPLPVPQRRRDQQVTRSVKRESFRCWPSWVLKRRDFRLADRERRGDLLPRL
jgi:hypothetical protein